MGGRGGSVVLIAAFFGPSDARGRRDRLERFLDGLGPHRAVFRAIECVAPGDRPMLAGEPWSFVVRSRSAMWHKERLLNLGLKAFAASAEVVGWVDPDIVFERDDWLEASVAALRSAEVVQPYSRVHDDGAAHRAMPSFASRVVADPGMALRRFHDHGHTGYAWLARGAVLQRAGLFDRCIVGGADHVMAHGFLGHSTADCLEPLLGPSSPLHAAFLRWKRDAVPGAALRLGCVEGTIVHMAHGTPQGRSHLGRNRALTAKGFDPDLHLEVNADACWEWSERGAREVAPLVEGYLSRRAAEEACA